ncbi:Uncharacterised protein [Klebsiella pneumoniae]|nr:Uncharacterised protein [Klebsiella pneumoniae]
MLGIQSKFFINMFTNCTPNHMTLDEHRVNITHDITNLHIVGIRRRFQCQIAFFARADLAYPVSLINITPRFVIKCRTVIHGNLRTIHAPFFIGYINNNSRANAILLTVNTDQFYIGAIACILDFKPGNFNLFDQFLIVSINGIEAIHHMMFMHMCR